MPDQPSAIARNPFPPGRSPFHVKGIVYQGTKLFFESQVKGGLIPLYQEIRDPVLLAFFMEQSFLPASFYDVLPVARLIRCEARAMRLSVAHYLRIRTRYQAEKDISSVYRFLLQLVSLEQVALRAPRMITQMFDFGTVTTSVVAPGHIEILLGGWPEMLVEWGSTAFVVYVETALRLSGAKVSEVLLTPHAKEPPRDGVEIATLKMDIRFA